MLTTLQHPESVGAAPDARPLAGPARWLPREGNALVVLGLAAVIGRLGGGLESPVGRIVMVALVVLFGVPHGALDHRLAMTLRGGWSVRNSLTFVAPYLVLAASVVVAWELAPLAALLAFLALTVVHFGLGDARTRGPARPLDVAVRGSLPIALPVALHPADTARPFAVLAERGTAEVADAVTAIAPALLALWVVGAVALVGRGWRRSGPTRAREDAVELGALAAVFAVLPPLSAFLVYFCAWHSARHVANAMGWFRTHGGARSGALALEVVALWLGGVGVLALVWTTAPPDLLARPSDAALRALFVGLAALTLPHVILVDARARPRFERAEPRPRRD